MTIVAVVTDHEHTILVADSLVSVASPQFPRTRELLSGGMPVEIGDQVECVMYENELKVARVGPIGIGYAGDVSKGHAVLELLRVAHQASPIESIDSLHKLLIESIIPSVTAPGDFNIALCGFFVGIGGTIKFICEPDRQGRHAFHSHVDPHRAFCIGSGREEYLREYRMQRTRSSAMQVELPYSLDLGLERVLRPIYQRQMVRDKLFLQRGVGGAVVCLYTDGHQINWQPSRTEFAYSWVKGVRLNAQFKALPYMLKTFVEGETLHVMFATIDDQGRPKVHYRLLRNPLSQVTKSTVRFPLSFDAAEIVITIFAGGPTDFSKVRIVMVGQDRSEPLLTETQREDGLFNLKLHGDYFLKYLYLLEDRCIFGPEAMPHRALDLRLAIETVSGTELAELKLKLAQCFIDMANQAGDAQSVAMAIALVAEARAPGVEYADAIEKVLREHPFGGTGELEVRAGEMARRKEYDSEYRRINFYQCSKCKFELMTFSVDLATGKVEKRTHAAHRARWVPAARHWLITCPKCEAVGTIDGDWWLNQSREEVILTSRRYEETANAAQLPDPS